MWFSPSVASAVTILLGASLICAAPVPNAASYDRDLAGPQEYSLFNRIQGTNAVHGPYDKEVISADRLAVLGE
ncbi:hypothetical protein EsDP_00001788 [Epichloe bromicola]|uniref:Uncharacterized protein n=1 Tax=Epichloe bromicola TaxID=79588 RepID=A0ABQ0CIX2_9HYPO